MEIKFGDDFCERFNSLGFKTGAEITQLDDDLINLVYDNRNLNLDYKNITWNFNYDKLINISKNFYKSLFKIHDIKYFDEEALKDINELKTQGLLSDPALKVIDDSAMLINPFELPLNEDYSSGIGALFLNGKYYFVFINLANINQRGIITTYTHEIAHTQLMSNHGSILNYKNQEVIPIFIELLTSKSIDNGIHLNNSLKVRLKNTVIGLKKLRKNVDSNWDLLISSGYIESALIAIDLFDLYCSSNISIQKELIKNIQTVFDGEQPLENILDNYGINFETSKTKNLFKKYIK